MEMEKNLHSIIDGLQKLAGSKSNLQNSSALNTSELSELAAALSALADERARNAKNTFISSMSHEIRTPLNAIMGFAAILEKKISDPELVGYARSISEGGNRLLRVLNDVLDNSSIETGITIQTGTVNSFNTEMFNDSAADNQSVSANSSELEIAFREIEQNIEIREQMSEVASDLEKDFLPRLKSIRKTFIMGQISEFAEDILQYNRNKGMKILDIWADRVISEVKTFDVKRLPETLNCFSKIIKQYKKSTYLA